jgi:KaiC/GvpD/RAD55 family RecA-like ATPase
MKVIVGGPECGKTTVLLHYVYNEIATLIEQANSGTVTAAVAVDGTSE